MAHGHNLSRFGPFGTRMYTISTEFFIILKSSKKDENMISCTKIYVESTKPLMGQGRGQEASDPPKGVTYEGRIHYLELTTQRRPIYH